MSQYPGSDPGQQPGNSAPQPDPRTSPAALWPGQQPGYAIQPGSQPGYPTQPTYPTQPGYPVQPSYPTGPGAPVPAQPPYGYPQQYVASPYQPVPAASGPKSPVLGLAALAIVVLATLGSLVGGWLLLQQVQQLLAGAVYTGSPSTDDLQQAMTTPIAGIGMATTIDLAGWIAAIVATATNRGRAAGIVAIVVGVIAPFAIWGYLALSFATLVQQYQ